MEFEKGTNLFVWFETRVFALSSLRKGGFWLRFLRKKAHKWLVFLVFSFLLCGFGFYPTRHGRSRFKKVYCNRVFFWRPLVAYNFFFLEIFELGSQHWQESCRLIGNSYKCFLIKTFKIQIFFIVNIKL